MRRAQVVDARGFFKPETLQAAGFIYGTIATI